MHTFLVRGDAGRAAATEGVEHRAAGGRDAIRWCEHCGTFYERFNGNAVVRVPSGNGNGNGEEEPK